MSADETEQNNVQDKYPEVVQKLTRLLEKYIAEGRSTPGAPQKNDAEINILKKVQEKEDGEPAKKRGKKK
jgi:hypothetical protein